MLRSSLIAASSFALMASAAAQTPQQLNGIHKVPGAVKHAGIYHVATGTWTRTGGGAVSNFGASDIVYSNTAESGYFSSAGGNGGFAAGSENFDEGGLPGTTNGNPFTGAGPNRDEYKINFLEFAYCDLGAAATSGWTFNFYESYDPCTLGANPDGTATVAGFPANGGCWLVDIDLAGAEFCLGADGGAVAPGWDNDPDFDSFGWSFTYSGTGAGAAGPLLCGDPVATDPTYVAGGLPLDGSNTYYGAVSACNSLGTGYLTRDFWWLEDPTAASSGCYFFGGYGNNNGCGGPSNPYASWYMQMSAEAGSCGTPTIGTIYCTSNPNSTGSNTSMTLLGSASAAANDLTLAAGNLPNNTFGFFLYSPTQGSVPNPGGSQGDLCLGGAIGRFVGAGQVKSSGAGTEITLSTTAGEWDLSALPGPTGSSAAVAGNTANFQAWHRDANPTVTSNFSDGITIIWQ